MACPLYAYNTTHQRFDDIAKLKRQILSGWIEPTECVTKEIIVVVWIPCNFLYDVPVRTRLYIGNEIFRGSADDLSATGMSNEEFRSNEIFICASSERAKNGSN